MTLSRLFQSRCFTQLRSISRIVQTCPTPLYDTGCTYCQVPLFPPTKQIDFQKDLHRTAPQPWKYVLVLLHGFSDCALMPSKINLSPGSFANEFEIAKKAILSPMHPVFVANIFLDKKDKKNQVSSSDSMHHVLIYPDARLVTFSKQKLLEFAQHYLLPEEPVMKAQSPFNPFSSESNKNVTPSFYQRIKRHDLFLEEPVTKDLVLICGHSQRDIRCGEMGPILLNEFTKVLEHECLDGAVDVGLISHVGGHAYASNVIYFPHDQTVCPVVWYGRVFLPNVQGIVKETVVGKKIISELYRGDQAQIK